MAGYIVHLAVVNEKALKDRAFVLGVEAPDMLSKHIKLYGLKKANDKYNTLRSKDMPEYKELQNIIESELGLHFGFSSNPDIKAFWSSLSENQKKSSFYKGYLWHLITDKIIYSKMDLDNKFISIFNNYKGNDIEGYKKELIKSLHSDWDKTNEMIRVKYNTELTPEIKELNVVSFNSDKDLRFVNWEILDNIIKKLKLINPLECNLSEIIDNIDNF